MELWWGSGSPFAWRVMLALLVKGVQYRSTLIEFSKRQNETPEFLALNPRGKVPVLVDDGLVIYESTAILRHLERRHPTPPLFGGSLAEQAAVDRMLAEMDLYLYPLGRRVSAPWLFGAERPATFDQDVADVLTELGRWEGAVGDRDQFVGDAITAVEIALYPMIRLFSRAADRAAAQDVDIGVGPFALRWPAITRALRSVETIPGIEATFPPHWGRPTLL